MILSRLTLRDFRNLGAQELAFPPGGAAIVGENAHGKSNLLEAIYYLETFRSFRGAKDAQLVAFDRDVFRVEGQLDASGVIDGSADSGAGSPHGAHTVAAAYDRANKTKRVTLDGQVTGALTGALGHLGAVVFSPSDIAMVDGAPVERRRFLDILLSLNRPGYVASLQHYRKVLSQRNAALKARGSVASVEAWNAGLVRAGAALIQGRHGWVAEVAEKFTQTYTAVSGREGATITYVSSVGRAADSFDSLQALDSAFHEALDISLERDQRTGTTSVGPHRDELRVSFGAGSTAENQEMRAYGSGGQRRTAALALRLVEASTVRATRGQDPIVLLDDAFAELDEARSRRLLELIDDGGMGQVILTAPKESDVRVRADVLPRWRIKSGRIEA